MWEDAQYVLAVPARANPRSDMMHVAQALNCPACLHAKLWQGPSLTKSPFPLRPSLSCPAAGGKKSLEVVAGEL
jgi:hypothetical protein